MYKVRLMVLGSDGQKIRVRVSKNVFVVGRGEDCDYVVLDGRASRRHCAVRIQGVSVLVEDLKSRNGSFINGAAIVPARPTRVFHDDELVVGTTRIRLSIRDRKTNQPLTPQQCGLQDPRSIARGEGGEFKDASELDSLVSQLDALISDLPPTRASSVEETNPDIRLRQQKEEGPPSDPSTSAPSEESPIEEDSQEADPAGDADADADTDADATGDESPAVDEGKPQRLPERLRKSTQNSQEAAQDALNNLFKRR